VVVDEVALWLLIPSTLRVSKGKLAAQAAHGAAAAVLDRTNARWIEQWLLEGQPIVTLGFARDS